LVESPKSTASLRDMQQMSELEYNASWCRSCFS
jgi:hypothetical protein